MKDLQEVFTRIQEAKREQREINAMYRDTLASDPEYQAVKVKLDELKTKKKQMENMAWAETGKQDRLDEIKLDIKQDKELLSDLALNNLVKGETVQVADEHGTEFEPVFTVRFKKK